MNKRRTTERFHGSRVIGLLYQMRSLFVAFLLLAARAACADDLDSLKAAAMCYVTGMKAVLALPEASGCLETIAKATEYAAAKIAYYNAARQAMPALLQIAKGKQTDSRYGEELTEIFRDFREDQDEQATATLEAKLHQCLRSDERDEALTAVKQAQRMAEQFIKDFGRLEGV